MTKRKRILYATPEKLEQVNKKNIKAYQTYIRSRLASNRDTKDTTYKTYQSYFNHFLVYLLEEWDNVYILSKSFRKDAVDIMEGFMVMCQEKLFNNKKVINTKVSAVSSYFHWAVRRGEIKHHPFDGRLERIRGAQDEKIINEHFLTQKEVNTITKTLVTSEDYDIIDRLIWGIMIDSANRVGAIERLTISSLDLEEMKFNEIREKRGKIVEVVFDMYTKEIIEEWLELREKELDGLEVDAFFITKYGGKYRPMSKSTIQRRINKIGLILGIEDFRSHSIRKTTLNLIHELTGDITEVAEFANHSSIATTQQSYIKPKSKTELRERINKARNKRGAK